MKNDTNRTIRTKRTKKRTFDVFSCPPNRLLNSKQAAKYLGFKVSYIYNLVYSGVLKTYKCGNKPNGSLRFLKSDLDAFLGRPKGGDKEIRE